MSEDTDFVRDLFPEAGEEIVRLFASAAENADLLHTDFFTIRDLVELSNYSGPETLYVLLLNLLLALEEGSLCVEASVPGLSKRLADLVDKPEARTWGQRLLADLGGSAFADLIGDGSDGDKPVVQYACAGRQFLYFQKFFHHERVLQETLSQRLQAPPPEPDLDHLRAVIQVVLVERPLQAEGRRLQLDQRQQLALGLALLRNVAIISGGPGTGKTPIVLTLLRCLVRSGFAPDRIALAAPTGRAAQRLTDALRSGLDSLGDLAQADSASAGSQCLHAPPAATLQPGTRCLSPAPGESRPGRRGRGGRGVHGRSGPDVAALASRRSPDEADPSGRQGPAPLGGCGCRAGQPGRGRRPTWHQSRAAAQLAELFPNLQLPEGRDPSEDVLVILEENYRSQPDIRAAARAINRRETEIVDRLPVVSFAGSEEDQNVFAHLEKQTGCWLLPQTECSVQELRQVLDQWAKHQYLGSEAGSYHELVSRCAGVKIDADMLPEHKNALDRLFQALARSRLLTLVRESPWGCVDINRFLDQQLRQRWDRFSRSGLFAGAPVLITRNDHVRQLYNGDVGVTLRSPGGGLGVVFPRQGGYAAFAAEALPMHELGFALTVHKSQGSEYGQVLLILPPAGGKRLLTKEMVYTGITRAKKVAVLCAAKDVLSFAISRKIERESGLMGSRLYECSAR